MHSILCSLLALTLCFSSLAWCQTAEPRKRSPEWRRLFRQCAAPDESSNRSDSGEGCLVERQ